MIRITISVFSRSTRPLVPDQQIVNQTTKLAKTSDNYRFSALIAMFGMLLHNSEFIGNGTYKDMIKLADNARGRDKDVYRAEFIRLAKATYH